MRRLDHGPAVREAGAVPASIEVRSPLPQYRDRIRDLVVSHPGVLTRLAEPIQLAGGDWSSDFIDGKLAVEEPDNFQLVGSAMAAAAEHAGVEFEAVGGLLLGAAPFTFAIAQAARVKWFLVRKEPKGRGTNRWIEGTRIVPGMPVVVVDDVVTKGGSIQRACEIVEGEGARVVFATTLVDRSDVARGYFEEKGVPYEPILTYRDLGIEPVGAGSPSAPPA